MTKLKGSILFTLYYDSYKEDYSISLGRIRGGENKTGKRLFDRNTAMNYKPEIYIDNTNFKNPCG